MDPRQPELALPRIKELVKQYENLEKRISKVTVSNELGQLEREGSLIVQEICLVAPRLHETLMNTSRNRRTELANGIVEKPVHKWSSAEKVVEAKKYLEQTIANSDVEKPVEKPVGEKKLAKKKTAKKGKK